MGTENLTGKEWTAADSAAAVAEGWDVFETSEGYYEIERDDDAGILADDDAAVLLVVNRAAEGSELHIKALEFHNRGL